MRAALMLLLSALFSTAFGMATYRLEYGVTGWVPLAGATVYTERPHAVIEFDRGLDTDHPTRNVVLSNTDGEAVPIEVKWWNEGRKTFARVVPVSPLTSRVTYTLSWEGREITHFSTLALSDQRLEPPLLPVVEARDYQWTCGFYRQIEGTLLSPDAAYFEIDLVRGDGTRELYTSLSPALQLRDDQSGAHVAFETEEHLSMRIRAVGPSGATSEWSSPVSFQFPTGDHIILFQDSERIVEIESNALWMDAAAVVLAILFFVVGRLSTGVPQPVGGWRQARRTNRLGRVWHP